VKIPNPRPRTAVILKASSRRLEVSERGPTIFVVTDAAEFLSRHPRTAPDYIWKAPYLRAVPSPRIFKFLSNHLGVKKAQVISLTLAKRDR
jgi:hypothetical protein